MPKVLISRVLAMLFTLFSLASLGGCGSGDSEAALDGECVAGELRCDGLVPQTCDAYGAWVSGAACDDACSEGVCTDGCDPGARQCDGLVPQFCNEQGAWVRTTACDYACQDGVCAGVCVPGTKKCDGLVPQTCDDDGAWVATAACDYLCTEGACGGVCVPGSKQCDGRVPQTCNGDGAWIDAAVCDYVCSEGSCGGVCVPGTKKCDGLVPQTCNDDGAWIDAAACDYVCSEGACGGVCVPGTKKCDGLVPQSCNDDGAWVDAAACDYVCSEGACGGVCVPGTKKCDGLVPQTCDDDGAWIDAAACDYVCSEGSCTGVCVPGDQRCADASSLETCDATGTWQASACLQVCSSKTQQCACEPGYDGDGTSCTPIDFCSEPNGGCSPNASCSQEDITPSCDCAPEFPLGDGYSCSAPATVVIDEGFDDITTLIGKGWLLANESSPVGTTSWSQGVNVSAAGPFDAFDGAVNAYISANFNNTTGGNGTISSWLATPVLDFGALAKVSFHTRSPTIPGGGTPYADRIEVRLCTQEPCELPSDSGVGSYTTVLTSVNPNLEPNGYPRTWTQITVTNAHGLPTSGQGRIAIRYYVTGAGPTGVNSDYIGIDRFVFEVGSPAYAVGGELTGLTDGAVVLWLNGDELLSLPADGAFTFARKLDDGTPYSVSIYEQPEGQTCTVTQATGSIEAADIANIEVSCTAE